MADKKKQHYVPKLYLRNFSWADKKEINIFNLPNQRNILHGSLKNQCYGDYFYGKDGKLEEAMGHLETPTSQIIQNIIDTQTLPQYHSGNHRILLAFIIIQNHRTKFTTEEQKEFVEKVVKTSQDLHPHMDAENIKQIQDTVTVPFHVVISESARLVPIAEDLKQTLLVNESEQDFITSDNPVIMYNMYLEKSILHSNIGWGSLGLQIFPLDKFYL